MPAMSNVTASPALSINSDSADEALCELLGLDTLELNDDNDNDDNTNANANANANTSIKERLVVDVGVDACDEPPPPPPSGVTFLTPPSHCQRPHSELSILFLQSAPSLFSPAQCRYMIHNLGYRATNDGGATFGPKYVTAAASSSSSPSSSSDEKRGGGTKVLLVNPNHHKVCVFRSELLLTWMQQAFVTSTLHGAIQNWWSSNNDSVTYPTFNTTNNNNNNSSNNNVSYRINPRFRLLQYDAKDDDVFLPHYDAITTSSNEQWQSQLTILVYLNTGGGVDFLGGETLFFNALDPKAEVVSIVPHGGQIIVFNHDLFHASAALKPLAQHRAHHRHDRGRGGTKFVLRSDVMFPAPLRPQREEHTNTTTAEALSTPPVDGTRIINDVIREWKCSAMQQQQQQQQLLSVLKELDMDQMTVSTFMVPGEAAVTTMLVDLELEVALVQEFVQECVKAVG